MKKQQLEGGITMITIRKSSQRGHANHGWLDSYHTFSFAAYYDPKHMGFGPLRVINEDRISPGKGFGTHGHEDMEILTYVLSGALAHKDSMGNVETLHANDLQRISAGTGIVHSEFNGSDTEPVHFLQIWLEPAVNGLPPSYQQLSLTEEQKLGKLVLVASPEGGGPLKIHQDAQVLIGQVEAGGQLSHRLQPGRQAWVHAISGAATVNGQPLATGDAAAVTGEASIRLVGIDANTEVLVFDLG
jgi:redox-sensitive bicupin YhaK (pirin superfamily)